MTANYKARSYVSTFATNIFIQGCTVLQGIVLARMLGPSGRGEYAAAILWPSIFAGLGIVGVNMAIARRAGKSSDPESLVKMAIGAAVITGGITTVLCGILLPYLIPTTLHHALPAAYLFMLFIPLNHVVLNLLGIDQGAGDFQSFNLVRAVLYPVFLVGLIICWFWADDKVFWVVATLLVANVTPLVVRLCRRSGQSRSTESFSIDGILHESFPFFGASVMSLLYQQCDKTLLVWLLSPQEIGYYVVAFSAGTVLNSMNQAIGTITFTSAANRQPGTGFPVVAQLLRRGALLSVIGALLLACALPFLLPLVYGASFERAVPVAILLLPGVTLASLADILNQDLRGQGQPIAGVASRVFGVVAIAGVGWSLSSHYGATGIAWGFMAGETISFAGLLFVALRFYKDADITHLLPSKSDLVFFWQRINRMGTSCL